MKNSAFCSVLCALLVLPAAAAKPAAEWVELEVRDVMPVRSADAHAVVLATADGTTILPVFVSEATALSIAFKLARRPPPHPLAGDLLGDVVRKLGGKVVEMEISAVESTGYEGKLYIQQGGKRLAVSARPADSLEVALDGRARIRTTRTVLLRAGITRGDIENLKPGLGVGGSGPSPDLQL